MRRSDDVHCRITEHTAEIPRHIRSDDVSAADVMHVVLVHGVIGMYHGNPLCGGNQLAKEAEGELRLRMDNVKVHAVDLFQHITDGWSRLYSGTAGYGKKNLFSKGSTASFLCHEPVCKYAAWFSCDSCGIDLCGISAASESSFLSPVSYGC